MATTRTTRYETRGWTKHAEEDVFEDGCQPGTATGYDGHEGFAAATVAGLVAKLQEFVGSRSADDVILDSCEEPGRVDIQVMETDDATPADAADIAAWQRGALRLWLATYTFHVERVTRETVQLAGVQ